MVFNLATGLVAGALSVLSSAIIKPLEAIIGVFTTQHKFVRLVKVDGLSILSKHNIERCESSVIFDSDYKWKLVFCPRGKKNPNNISLYVEIEDAASLPVNWFIILDLQFFIISQQTDNYLPLQWRGVSFNSSNTIRGIDSWTSLEQLSRSGFLLNDSLIVGFEITNLRWNPLDVQRPAGTGERLRLIEKPPNSKFTWKITKFSTFKQATHFSDAFIVGQRKWSIQMYPKGALEGEGNSLSLFLTALDYLDNAPSRARTLAKYNLRVLNQLGGAHLESPIVSLFGASGAGFGGRRFMPFKDLYDKSKGYLVNDVMYIGVEFHVISVIEPC